MNMTTFVKLVFICQWKHQLSYMVAYRVGMNLICHHVETQHYA